MYNPDRKGLHYYKLVEVDMPFSEQDLNSKPAIYSYCIAHLSLIMSNKDVKDEVDNIIVSVIEKLKIAFENHQQDSRQIVSALNQIKLEKVLPQERAEVLTKVLSLLRKSQDINPSDQIRFSNIFKRRFESELSINLLLNPTDAMMKSVGRISKRILEIINSNPIHYFSYAWYETSNKISSSYSGLSKDFLTITNIKKILQDNNKKNLNQIMMFHLWFWNCVRSVSTYYKISLPRWEYEPIGVFKEFAAQRVAQLQSHMDMQSTAYYHCLTGKEIAYFSDQYLYDSSLYKSRGRINSANNEADRLGVMLQNQEAERYAHLGKQLNLKKWRPDVLNVLGDFSNSYVHNLLANDAVYVSGSSGLMTLFLSLMEIVGNFPNIQMKQNYVAACVAYIVAGGLHSIHEVLAPATFVLKLFPEYDGRNPAPKYHTFIQAFSADQQFQNCVNQAWANFNSYVKGGFNLKYKPIYAPVIQKLEVHPSTFFQPAQPKDNYDKIASATYDQMLIKLQNAIINTITMLKKLGQQNIFENSKHAQIINSILEAKNLNAAFIQFKFFLRFNKVFSFSHYNHNHIYDFNDTFVARLLKNCELQGQEFLRFITSNPLMTYSTRTENQTKILLTHILAAPNLLSSINNPLPSDHKVYKKFS